MGDLRTTLVHSKNLHDNVWRELSMQYSMGGLSFMDYKEKPRGFRLSISIVRRENGCKVWEPFQKGDGVLHVEVASRFNAKKFAMYVERVKQNADLIHTMCETEGNYANLTALLQGLPMPNPENLPETAIVG